ncbi:MAG: beta-xylosidase [Acidobacteria bacterium]|nr:beta-xylosidase [Acidobacteriota bacterium]
MTRFPALLLLALALHGAEPIAVKVKVDASRPKGALKPIWAFFGYDEPNYTYMKDGRKLLTQLAEASPVPVFVRAHNLLSTGDGTPALKWGSTNAYTEDAAGRPVYDWTITDRIFDSYVERGMKPLVEIGFMPEALSVKPQPYRHQWKPEDRYASIVGGWAYPPKDYGKWRELVKQWVKHCVERYGEKEVASWWWEVWNEPDILYWQGTPEEYAKLYDYAADGLKTALPAARIGGPHSTGPGSAKAAAFLKNFLEHAVRGTNYATGRRGSPLDYVGFHAKGRPVVEGGHVRMGIREQLKSVEAGFAVVKSFPELQGIPIIIGESDPEGCAACPVRTHPQNGYRNGTMYSSYTAASFARKWELAERMGVNLEGAVTWAFEFEGQPWFDGFRDLATNGVEKAVLNVFRMYGMMAGERVEASSAGAVGLDEMLQAGVAGRPDVGVLATRRNGKVWVMLWHYHDADMPGPDAEVELSVAGLSRPAMVREWRVDEEHGNAFAVWKQMGSPAEVTERQRVEIERRAGLELGRQASWMAGKAGETAQLRVVLKRQATVLIEFN